MGLEFNYILVIPRLHLGYSYVTSGLCQGDMIIVLSNWIVKKPESKGSHGTNWCMVIGIVNMISEDLCR